MRSLNASLKIHGWRKSTNILLIKTQQAPDALYIHRVTIKNSSKHKITNNINCFWTWLFNPSVKAHQLHLLISTAYQAKISNKLAVSWKQLMLIRCNHSTQDSKSTGDSRATTDNEKKNQQASEAQYFHGWQFKSSYCI